MEADTTISLNSINSTSNSNSKLLREIRICLLKSQYSPKNGALVRKVKLLFYDPTKYTTLKKAKEFRSQFGSCFWRLMLVVFDQKSTCPTSHSRNILAFFKKLTMALGTVDDMVDTKLPNNIKSGQNCQPFFITVIQLITLVLNDRRSHVRLNIMQILYDILEAKHEDPSYLQWRDHRGLREKLLLALKNRIIDEIVAIRIITIKCLKYFSDHSSIVDCLKYLKSVMGNERNSGIRAEIVSIMDSRVTAKTKFFVRALFDPSGDVRVLAMKALAKRDMKEVGKIRNLELIFNQCLLHPDILRQELIPSWVEQFEGKLDVLLSQFNDKNNLYKRILNAIFIDDSDATFEKANISFLNQDRLVPIDKLDIEQCYIWMFMLYKFKNQHTTLRLILPSQEKLPEYFGQIAELAVQENKNATFHGYEESATNVECLAITLQLIPFYTFEEGNRQKIKKFLIEILRNEIMDEISLLASAVKALQLIDPKYFEFTIIDVLTDLLNPRPLEIFDVPMSPPGDNNCFLVPQPPPPQNLFDGNGNIDDEILDENPNEVESMLSSQMSVHSQSFARKPILSETRLKEAIAKLMLEINKLQQFDCGKGGETAEEYVTRQNHLLLLKETLKKFKAVRDEPLKRMEELDQNDWKIADGHSINLSIPNSSIDQRDNEEIINERINSIILSPVSVNEEGRRNSVSKSPEDSQESNILDQLDNSLICRCIVIMKTFLVYGNKIPPIIRNFYEKYAMQFFVREEGLLRCYTIELITLMALLDESYARSVIHVLFTAVENDLANVKNSAFRGISDILCHFDFSKLVDKNVAFRSKNDRVFPFDPKPNGEIDPPEIVEQEVVKLLKKYETAKVKVHAGGSPKEMLKKDRQELIQRTIMKLLMCDRFVTPKTISGVLLYWLDPYNEFSGVKIMCENFVTHYVRKSVGHANKMVLALIQSFKTILEGLNVENSDWRAKNAIYKQDNYKTDFFIKLLILVGKALHPHVLAPIFAQNFEEFHPAILFNALKLIFGELKNEFVCDLFCIYDMLEINSPGDLQKFQYMTQIILWNVQRFMEGDSAIIHFRNCKRELKKHLTKLKGKLTKKGFVPMVLNPQKMNKVDLNNIQPENAPQEENIFSDEDEENQPNIDIPNPNELEDDENLELEQSLLEFQEE